MTRLDEITDKNNATESSYSQVTFSWGPLLRVSSKLTEFIEKPANKKYNKKKCMLKMESY